MQTITKRHPRKRTPAHKPLTIQSLTLNFAAENAAFSNPFLLILMHTLLRFFALPKIANSFKSTNYTLFAQNTRGVGWHSTKASQNLFARKYQNSSRLQKRPIANRPGTDRLAAARVQMDHKGP
jgi:hypothetical protein